MYTSHNIMCSTLLPFRICFHFSIWTETQADMTNMDQSNVKVASPFLCSNNTRI